jgi:hypothetical protein
MKGKAGAVAEAEKAEKAEKAVAVDLDVDVEGVGEGGAKLGVGEVEAMGMVTMAEARMEQEAMAGVMQITEKKSVPEAATAAASACSEEETADLVPQTTMEW